eukprot:TRINITY_DN75359_c0_g1_i1.p1 TRINITY_DN75359_c0_g1~~TRINITY_DN75359_c0_g1_i1.p1  ORF type:complete len:126 (-),score=10.90 TRINITY_DN75359_c0_g1_i1:205-582(-)
MQAGIEGTKAVEVVLEWQGTYLLYDIKAEALSQTRGCQRRTERSVIRHVNSHAASLLKEAAASPDISLAATRKLRGRPPRAQQYLSVRPHIKAGLCTRQPASGYQSTLADQRMCCFFLVRAERNA